MKIIVIGTSKFFSEVIQYANEYLADNVICVIEQIALSIDFDDLYNINRWEECFAFSEVHSLNKAKESCIKYIKKTTRPYKFRDAFVEKLSPDARLELVKALLEKSKFLSYRGKVAYADGDNTRDNVGILLNPPISRKRSLPLPQPPPCLQVPTQKKFLE